MKILMILESFFPPDKRVENEIATLTDSGHEVHILCFGKEKALEYEQYKGAVIHRIKPGRVIIKSSVAALSLPIYFKYWNRQLKKILNDYHFDVVHVHDLPLIKPVYELKSIYKFRIVLDLHENWPALLNVSPHTKTVIGRILCSIKQWKEYERNYINNADRIIVVVEEAKSRILKLNVPDNKIFIVSNTLKIDDNESIITTHKKKGNKKVLIYEGGITYHRGIQFVLKALSKLNRQDLKIEFRIIGKGSYLKNLKEMSRKLNLEGSVKFMGWLKQKQVYESLAVADAAIIPHIKSDHTDNTVPHKLFHYMYAGLPVIASNCNPIKRILKESKSGYIYNYDNPDEIAVLLKSLFLQRNSEINEAGRKLVEKKYNWDSDARELLELYNNI